MTSGPQELARLPSQFVASGNNVNIGKSAAPDQVFLHDIGGTNTDFFGPKFPVIGANELSEVGYLSMHHSQLKHFAQSATITESALLDDIGIIHADESGPESPVFDANEFESSEVGYLLMHHSQLKQSAQSAMMIESNLLDDISIHADEFGPESPILGTNKPESSLHQSMISERFSSNAEYTRLGRPGSNNAPDLGDTAHPEVCRIILG